MLGRPAQAQLTSEDADNPYWVSFSDIMAGLLVIFILSLIYLMIQLFQEISLNRETRNQVQEVLAQLSRIEEIREEILNEVKTDLAELNIEVEIVEDNTVLRIPESQLYFEQSRYEIPISVEPVVGAIGSKILDAIQRDNRLEFIDTIFVEGHTDGVPMNREMGNWGLSTYRAISVWNYWTALPGNLSALKELKNRKGEAVFSVSGYADTRRAQAIEITEADQKKNRRIDIRFTMHTPEGADLRELIRKLEDAEQRPAAAGV